MSISSFRLVHIISFDQFHFNFCHEYILTKCNSGQSFFQLTIPHYKHYCRGIKSVELDHLVTTHLQPRADNRECVHTQYSVILLYTYSVQECKTRELYYPQWNYVFPHQLTIMSIPHRYAPRQTISHKPLLFPTLAPSLYQSLYICV